MRHDAIAAGPTPRRRASRSPSAASGSYSGSRRLDTRIDIKRSYEARRFERNTQEARNKGKQEEERVATAASRFFSWIPSLPGFLILPFCLCGSVLAEVELGQDVLGERIAAETAVALGAEVEAEVGARRRLVLS